MTRFRQALLVVFLGGVIVALWFAAPRGSADSVPPDLPGLVIPATVTRVVDGDSFEVRLESGPERVRLFGVDAPEAKQPFGREASRALRRMIEGRMIELQPLEDDPTDAYDRLIAVVYLDGTDVNETLVGEGHAWAYRRYLGQLGGAERYCELEAQARGRGAGLWSQPAERWVPPWIYRARSRALPGARVPSRDYARETVADCVAAIGEPAPAPEVSRAPTPQPVVSGECRIKGNVNRNGDRIYHLPGSHSYDDTRIDTAKGERWFCSEEEARRAGWRAVQ